MFTASYGPGRTAGFGDVPGFPSPSNVTNKFEALTGFNARTVNTGSVPEVTKITMDFEGDPAPQLYTGKQRGQQGDPMLVVNKPEFNHVSGQMRPKQACALSVGVVNRILRETPAVITRCQSDFPQQLSAQHGQFKEVNDIASIFSFAGLLLHLKGDATGSDNGPKAGSHYTRQRQAAIQVKGLVSQCANLWMSNSTPLCGDYGYFVLAKVVPHPDAVAELIAKMERAINHPNQADPYPAGDKFSQMMANRNYRDAVMRNGKMDAVWQFMPVLVRQCRIANIRRLLTQNVFSDQGTEFAFFRMVQFKELVALRSDHAPISAIHCALGLFEDTDAGKDTVYTVVPRAELYICTDFDDVDSCPSNPRNARQQVQPAQPPGPPEIRRDNLSAPANAGGRPGDDLSQREILQVSVPARDTDLKPVYVRKDTFLLRDPSDLAILLTSLRRVGAMGVQIGNDFKEDVVALRCIPWNTTVNTVAAVGQVILGAERDIAVLVYPSKLRVAPDGSIERNSNDLATIKQNFSAYPDAPIVYAFKDTSLMGRLGIDDESLRNMTARMPRARVLQ